MRWSGFLSRVLCLNLSAGINAICMAFSMLHEIFGGRLLGHTTPVKELTAGKPDRVDPPWPAGPGSREPRRRPARNQLWSRKNAKKNAFCRLRGPHGQGLPQTSPKLSICLELPDRQTILRKVADRHPERTGNGDALR
ncbi:MAG: hypothetical protein EBX35_15625 [Planctomycetia bacterium]|nr:hypothetical protein [Planctomycetia bacterium]